MKKKNFPKFLCLNGSQIRGPAGQFSLYLSHRQIFIDAGVFCSPIYSTWQWRGGGWSYIIRTLDSSNEVGLSLD